MCTVIKSLFVFEIHIYANGCVGLIVGRMTLKKRKVSLLVQQM